MVQKALRYSGYESFAAGDHALVLRGRAHFMGNDGTFELVVEPNGAFRQSIEAPLADSYAESGAGAWAVDWTGMPRTLVSREREWNQMLTAVLSGGWAAEAGRFHTTPAGEAQVHLTHGEGPTRAMLELDPATGRPTHLTYDSVLGVEEWTFEGVKQAGDVRVPQRFVQEGAGLKNVWEVESVTLEPSPGPEHYATMPPHPTDMTFDAATSSTLKFRRAPTGHLLVQPLVNGKDIGWFIFDTGAGGSCAIDKVALEKLGLEEIGETGLVSIQGRSLTRVFRASTLQLGPVTLDHPVLVEMDLSPFTAHFDVPVVGVVGYDLISRCVVDLNLEADEVTLHDPAAFDGAGIAWQPLVLIDRHPVISAKFEGREGLFKLDAGASSGPFGNVTFHAPAVERFSLLEGRETQNVDVGVGTVNIGTVEWFELNGHRFDNPSVAFADPGPGPFSDAYTVGNIGVEFLKPFRVVFDYSRDRLALME